jgi:hypothetical protein
MTPARAPSPGPRRAVVIDESGDREFLAATSTIGCVEGVSAILRLVNTILSDALSSAENEARTALFAASVSERHKS